MSYRNSSSSDYEIDENKIRWAKRFGIFIIGVVVLIVATVILDSVFGYVWYKVGDRQVGVKFHANNPYEVVGPGVWTNLGMWEDIKTVSVEGVPFMAFDKEVLTKDQQRIGVQVAGTVHREPKSLILKWAAYASFYQSDDLLNRQPVDEKDTGGLMYQLSKQAMKVCVGESIFTDAVVGAARDALRDCINENLDGLVLEYGLEVRNIVVPDIILGEAVQTKMDEATESRFAATVARENEKKAKADADYQLAIEQGIIRVEQGKIQEKSKQDAITAKLNKEKLDAELEVITAEKRNILEAAQKDSGIAKVKLEIAELDARATMANTTILAQVYSDNPSFAEFRQIEVQANALKAVDKVMIVPPGTNPLLFLNSEATTPIAVSPDR